MVVDGDLYLKGILSCIRNKEFDVVVNIMARKTERATTTYSFITSLLHNVLAHTSHEPLRFSG